MSMCSPRSRSAPATARSQTRLGALLVLVIVVLSSQASPGRAQIGGGSIHSATADARLAELTFSVRPPIGFNPLADPGNAVAQAQIDSLGTSAAFASSAYPGASVVTLDGTLAVLTNGMVGSEEVPPYPLIAKSEYPLRPEDTVEAGSLRMRAESTAVTSRGSATDGLGRGAAVARYDTSTEKVIARADTRFGLIKLGELLTIQGAHSLAEVRQSPSAELERTSVFDVSTLTVMGVDMTVGSHGLALEEEVVAMPREDGMGIQPVLDALAEHGVELTFFPAEEFDGGVQTAGLEITVVQAPPPSLASGVESVVTTITLGGNMASVDNRAAPSPPSLPNDVATVVPEHSPPSGVEGGTSPTPVAPSLSSIPPVDSPATPQVAQPETPQTTPHAASLAPAETKLVVAEAMDTPLGGFYSLFGLGGFLLFVAARCFHLLSIVEKR